MSVRRRRSCQSPAGRGRDSARHNRS
jgi:hypothetical protein